MIESLAETKTLLVISQDQLGHGDAALGALLIDKFMKTLPEIALNLSAIVCYNSGVKLLVEGSSVLASIKAYELRGTTVLACGTCIDYFNLRDKLRVGRISNMHEIVSLMAEANRTLTL